MELMIDIETFGTGPTAVIVQVGWCYFTTTGIDSFIGEPERVWIDPQDCINQGLTVDGDTILWWLKQSDAAQRSITDGSHLSLSGAFDVLDESVRAHNPTTVWANPPQFDLSILRHAYSVLGRRLPWGHRAERCARTLWNLHDDPRLARRHRPVVKHDAGWDAHAQALSVQECLNGWYARKETP